MARSLGVDGGGTKTASARSSTTRAAVIARATAPTSLLLQRRLRGRRKVAARRVLRTSARRPASRPTTSTPRSSGCPATARPAATSQQLDAVPRGVLGHDRYSCDNDMVCGWAGSLAGAGRHQRHQRHRVDDLRRAPGRRPPGRRLGRAVRRRGLGVLDCRTGPQRVLPDERRPPAARPAARDAEASASRSPAISTSSSLVIDTWQGDRSKIAALATTVAEAARRRRRGLQAHPRRGGRRARLADRDDPDADQIHRRGDRAGVLLRRHVQAPRAISNFRHRDAERSRQVRPPDSAARSSSGRRAVRRQAQRTSAE